MLNWGHRAANGVLYSCIATRELINGKETAQRVSATNMETGEVIDLPEVTLKGSEKMHAGEEIKRRIESHLDHAAPPRISG